MENGAIRALRAFGRRADNGLASAIAEGGFVVAGDASSALITLAETGLHEQRTEPQGGWVGKGEGQGAQTETTSSHQAAHTLGQLSIEGAAGWELEGLSDYFPDVKVIGSPSRFALLMMSVGLLPESHVTARLYLEVPLRPWDRTTMVDGQFGESQSIVARSERAFIPMPPPVRAWAVWQGGMWHGFPVRSHHENPDGSICACMSYEWIRGVHRVVDYAAFCTSWIVKVLYDHAFNHYPGPQHLPPWIRLERLRLDDKCGCGQLGLYRSCCWSEDRRIRSELLARDRIENSAEYFRQLRVQGRPPWPLGEGFRRF